MLMTKLKVTAALLFVAGLIVAGAGIFINGAVAGPNSGRSAATAEISTLSTANLQRPKKKPGEQPKRRNTVAGKVAAVDAAKHSITLSIFSRQTGATTEKTFSVAKDVKVMLSGKRAKLADIKKGARATLGLTADQKKVESIRVAGATTQATVKSVDAGKNTITITAKTRQGKVDKTFQVAKDAKVTVEGKAAKLADLKSGTTVALTFAADDDKMVVEIRTPGRRVRENNPQPPAQPEAGAAAEPVDVQKILAGFDAAMPTKAQLEVYRLRWAQNFAEAKDLAAKENRPILISASANIHGNTFTGHT